jgi:hypothetical protein
MGSRSKASRLDQKAYWKEKLDERLLLLADRGLEPEKMARDGGVRKIRAEIRKAGARLKVISDSEQKTEDMARSKAEKVARPKKEKGKGAEEGGSVVSKRQQKKMKKIEGKVNAS